MTCRDCKHWQGTKHSTYGDCYRIIGTLAPSLFSASIGDTDWNVPHDPLDHIKWWNQSLEYRKAYRQLRKLELPCGIKRERVNKCDFFMTKCDHSCILKTPLT